MAILKNDGNGDAIWNALDVATRPSAAFHNYSSNPAISPAAGQESVSVDPFTKEDVTSVLGCVAEFGDYAETEVWAVLRLKDGRYAFVNGSCDTTGWDCQAGGSVVVSADLAALLQFGLTDEARRKLGV